MNGAMLYDDGRLACDDAGILIRRYYLWGEKRIPYPSIRSVKPADPSQKMEALGHGRLPTLVESRSRPTEEGDRTRDRHRTPAPPDDHPGRSRRRRTDRQRAPRRSALTFPRIWGGMEASQTAGRGSPECMARELLMQPSVPIPSGKRPLRAWSAPTLSAVRNHGTEVHM